MNDLTFQELTVNGKTKILILLVRNFVVAQVMIDKERNELFNLFVDENQRSQGYAKYLLRKAIEIYHPKYIEASNCYGSDIMSLIKLYKEVGFEIKDNVRMEIDYLAKTERKI